MSREKELVKNTAILSLGRFLPNLTSFITLPIMTAYLTKSEYGTYDLISTLVMLLIPIATLQIQSAAFRFLIDCRDNKEMSSRIISNIFLVTLPITVVASIAIQFVFINLTVYIRGLIALYFFLDTIHLTLGQIARGVGENKIYSIGAILLSLTYTVVLVVSVYLSGLGLIGVLIAFCISKFFGSLYLAKKINVHQYLNWEYISILKAREMLSYSWPMVPNNLSSWVLKLSDRLVITFFLGVEANAMYAVANKIPNVLSMAQSVMVMAWQENASIAVNDDDAEQYYSKMLNNVFNLMIGCTALLVAGSPILFWLLIKGDYKESYYQMPILILAMFFFVMSSFFGGIYIAHKRTKNVGITTMIAAAINLIINLLFVNVIGIWAGSISTLVAYLVLYIYRMINCQSFQPMHIDYGKQALLIILIIFMLLIELQNTLSLNVANGIFALVFFAVLNRKIIVVIIKKIKSKLIK